MIQKRHALAALTVLISTVVTPIAEVHWSPMTLEFPDHELYFIWGTYSLLYHRIWIDFSRLSNPYLTLGLSNLIVLWALCGIVLSVIILYSSRTSHRPLVVWAVVASVLVAQILLPINVFGALTGAIGWDLGAFTTYLLPLPIPSILALALLIALYYLGRQEGGG